MTLKEIKSLTATNGEWFSRFKEDDGSYFFSPIFAFAIETHENRGENDYEVSAYSGGDFEGSLDQDSENWDGIFHRSIPNSRKSDS